MNTKPLKPFTIVTAGGRGVPTKNHDCVLLSPFGRTTHVCCDHEKFIIRDVLMVTQLMPGIEEERSVS